MDTNVPTILTITTVKEYITIIIIIKTKKTTTTTVLRVQIMIATTKCDFCTVRTYWHKATYFWLDTENTLEVESSTIQIETSKSSFI